MNALEELQRVIRSGNQPDEYLVEEACSEAFAYGRVDLAIAISEAWPSTYGEDPQEEPSPDPPSPSADGEDKSDIPPTESKPPEGFPRVSSPLKGVTDDAWNEFVDGMRTEEVSFSTEKYIGAFRYRKERFVALGGGDGYEKQYDAFQRDMVAQYTQGRAKALIDKYAGLPLPGEEGTIVTPSGILALAKAAGPKAESWITDKDIRKDFPGTTGLFNTVNGIF